MTPQEMLEQMIDKATLDFIEIAKEEEDGDYSDAMQSMERKYWEGQVDALGYLYGLTYQLSFAIMDKNNKETE